MSATLPLSFDEIEQQLLIELLPSSLPESVIVGRLRTMGISPEEISDRLLLQEERALVASIPGFSEAVWCLTSTGRAMAQGLTIRRNARHQPRQITMFSQDHEKP